MATKNWNGSSASFDTAANWSPTDVPVSGDVAVISAGTVTITRAPTGVTIQLIENANATTATTLNLTNVTLDASTPLIVVNNQTLLASAAPTINVSGTVTLAGAETFNSSTIAFSIASGSTLVNTGSMTFNGASPVFGGGGLLTNNAVITLNNVGSVAQAPVFGNAVNGTGQIGLGSNARIEFDNSVSSGQTLAFSNGASGNEVAQFNAVGSFGGLITGFAASDLLAVVNTPYTGATYTSTGANAGLLQLYSGTTLEGSLNFSGNYDITSFTFKFNDFGSGQSNLQITTTGSGTFGTGSGSGAGAGAGAGAGSGGTGSGGTGGGTGGNGNTTVGAVYRFFDTKFGTHFFTSDTNERDTVLATRSADLKQETNGFGDGQATDTSAVAVYRFFDTNFGTHFFTANAGERDTIINTRPDLTYEASSTFYEHSSMQTGDTAVYRLFDTKTGTQFLTGDTNEYAGLTTAGSGTYRADLRSEGVAFYAPKGTFT